MELTTQQQAKLIYRHDCESRRAAKRYIRDHAGDGRAETLDAALNAARANPEAVELARKMDQQAWDTAINHALEARANLLLAAAKGEWGKVVHLCGPKDWATEDEIEGQLAKMEIELDAADLNACHAAIEQAVDRAETLAVVERFAGREVFCADCDQFDNHATGYYASTQEAEEAFWGESRFEDSEKRRILVYSRGEKVTEDLVEIAKSKKDAGSPSPVFESSAD